MNPEFIEHIEHTNHRLSQSLSRAPTTAYASA